MRKLLFIIAAVFCIFLSGRAFACTNIIVTRGASADGSNMVSYAADSYHIYGELYFHKAARWKKGDMVEVSDWDDYIHRGSIPQVPRTYKTVGNMNEHQLIITETTFGGREELVDTAGIIDYGSLIYITLQRARTAREAIETMVSLANGYGYPSEGETFSIADTEEAWIMEMIGKGPGSKGVVWVAMRVPDGYICAHANQSRISTFPKNDPENCLFAPDVISFAREKGYFSGSDDEFSFCDAYNPLDFGGARSCEARAWSALNILSDGKLDSFLEYAMGFDLSNRMPLFVKPDRKLGVKDVADAMRDHYEGTPMDMTKDVGAGANGLPYRWRPLYFDHNGSSYVNERGIATQQTGFWMVGQARGYLPDEVGGLLWFAVDDAATSYLTPIYTNINAVPECLREGNGTILDYSPTSQFWLNNRIANACYKLYDLMAPYVREKIDLFENLQIGERVPQMDAKALELCRKGRIRKAKRLLTKFSISTAVQQFGQWKKLEETLLVKYLDGVVKAQNEDGSFKRAAVYSGMPEDLQTPGYTDRWKEYITKDNGESLKIR